MGNGHNESNINVYFLNHYNFNFFIHQYTITSLSSTKSINAVETQQKANIIQNLPQDGASNPKVTFE